MNLYSLDVIYSMSVNHGGASEDVIKRLWDKMLQKTFR